MFAKMWKQDPPASRPKRVRYGRLRFETLEPRLVLDGLSLVINELMAANDDTLADEDGDNSDWIEIHNPSEAPVELDGWSLTKDTRDLAEWTFTDGTLLPGESIVVFASGKDRQGTGVGGEFHTNFRLDADGDYLALVASDGVTVVSQVGSADADYPPQREDIAYGIGNIEPSVLIEPGTGVDVLVPTTSGELPPDWNTLAYVPDGNWIAGATGVGFESVPSGPQPLGYWSFDDFGNANQALDDSGNDHHGTISGASYTADGSGYSGQPGDRALDFGPAGNSAHVNITDAALAAFDSATANNAITISLWLFGGADQPANDCTFWGSSEVGGGGIRTVNAHVPWSDSTIYWDTGGASPDVHRIAKYEPDASHWKGQWNHYVFIKDGDRKEIWQNGALFHSDTNTAVLDVIRDFIIGAGYTAWWSYGGWIDDFAVWDLAISGEQVAALWQGVSPLELSDLSGLIGTDLGDVMPGNNASAFLRIPFEVETPSDFDAMLLRMQYDDGFVAYLNGQEVARRNAPDPIAWNSTAMVDRSLEDAMVAEEFDLGRYADLLQQGANLLAIQGSNVSLDAGEFLILPELIAAKAQPNRYLEPATPGGWNAEGFVDFVADTSFSVDRGFYDAPFDVQIATATPGAEIRYTLDGSEPTAATGIPYTGPIHIATTTTLRAAAFKEDWQPTDVDGQTYLFLDDVIRQPAQPAGFPDTWNNGPGVVSPMPALVDYEMDPSVVDAAPFTDSAAVPFDMKDALQAIPTMSLVMDLDDLFDLDQGIYANAMQEGYAWERPASLEYIDPNTGQEFQLNCGVRMHGGWNRFPEMLKKSFRIYFRDDYGPEALEFPLFPDSPVERFEKLVLRSGNGKAWPSPWRDEAGLSIVQYLRDQFLRDVQRDMGQVTSHGNFVHLYINGLYWGLYNPVERPDADFGESHLGGDRDDYDVVRWHRGEGIIQIDGELDAWNAMMEIARGGMASDDAYQQIGQYLDIDAFIDYMIVNIFTSNFDWPDSNAYALRRRTPDGRFYFVSWDAEESLFNLWDNRTDLNYYNTAGELYMALRANGEFRMEFADRVHRHFFNGGALTPEENDARWMDRATEIDRAIVAESARWGDLLREPPYRRDVEWLTEQNRLRFQYFTVAAGQNRSEVVLDQFKTIALYPGLDAPSFNQHGGDVPADFQLVITNPSGLGDVYYTLDGSDPRPGGSDAEGTLYTGPVTIDRSAVVKARVLNNNQWSALNEAEFYVEGQPVQSDLVITELNYNPKAPSEAEQLLGFADNDDFEFVELENIGDEPLDLTGVRFVDGIGFEFTSSYQGTPILITEAGTGTPDYFEIQNVSDSPVDTSGWIVAANNASSYDINDVHSPLWTFPDAMAPEQLAYRADTIDDNIYWRTGKDGWVMIVDDQGAIVDFVIWGYGPDDLALFNVSVHGFSGNPLSLAWNGEAVSSQGADSTALQRVVGADHDDATDWSFDLPPSAGEDNPALPIPFPGEPIELKPGGFVVIARNAAAVRSRYGDQVEVAGQYTGKLDNSGEWIGLVDPFDQTIADFQYGDSGNAGWPDRADGNGSSLEVIDPLGDYNHPDNWRSSSEYGGSPGVAGLGPYDGIVINEALTHSDQPLVDAIELYNPKASEVEVGGWWLSDSNNDLLKFQIPADTTIPAGGYQTFYEGHWVGDAVEFDQATEFGGPGEKDFALSGTYGDDVWLLLNPGDGSPLRFADHVEFGAALNGESFGRWLNSEGKDYFYPMKSRTLDASNSGPRVGPKLLISEVMYNPGEKGVRSNLPERPEGCFAQIGPDPFFALEFLELYNPTGQVVNLTDWRLRKGLDFDFPAGTTLEPQEALVVVSFDPLDAIKLADFRSRYGIGPEVQIVGGHNDQLDDDGERIQLQDGNVSPPDDPLYIPHPLEDEVDYNDTWYATTDGGGESLNRIATNLWGNEPGSWLSAEPTPGVASPQQVTEVIGRHVFYNNSAWDNVIATDKVALRPGEIAAFANYTSYALGLNGITIDVLALAEPTAITADDFIFKMGNDDTPGDWDPAPAPGGVDVRAGEGSGGSDRITLIWDDHAIENQWLEVNMRVTPHTGLTESDLFYFGNAIGETGNTATDAAVDAVDVLLTRNNPQPFWSPAGIDNAFDHNRDRRVDAIDTLIARNHQSWAMTELSLIDLTGVKASKDVGWDEAQRSPTLTGLEEGGTSSQPTTPTTVGFEGMSLDWLYEFEQMDTQKRISRKSDAVDKLLATYGL